MEVEVSELFGPKAGKRPPNFIVLKYFLLGLLISNGIESILIIPKTLSLMDENEEVEQKLNRLYDEHDAYRDQIHELRNMVHEAVEEEKETFDKTSKVGIEKDLKEKNATHGKGHHQEGKPVVHSKPKMKSTIGTKAVHKESLIDVDTNKMVEIVLLIYGVVTLGMGIFAVFKEHARLLMYFIGVVACGLIVLFFSGLSLIVFMAILNDVIIALIAVKFLMMINQSSDEYSAGILHSMAPQFPINPAQGQYAPEQQFPPQPQAYASAADPYSH